MRPNEYWNSDDASRDQKFYAAFCILVSSCTDYAVGAELRSRKKLNWACTVLYYSLVHAARLVCFVETGDFPTGHKELGELFMYGSRSVGRSWVRRRLQPIDHRVEPVTDFSLLRLSLENRKRWGQILTQARELRDDANYEGLLISHEYSHIKITDCFKRLAITLEKASEQLLPDALHVFKTFVDNSPRRDYWYAFLNWKNGHGFGWSVSEAIPSGEELSIGEGLYYLEDSLKNRGASKRILALVLQWLNDLRRDPDLDIPLAKEVHDNIVYSVFALKSRLFDEFKTKIDSLSSYCRG